MLPISQCLAYLKESISFYLALLSFNAQFLNCSKILSFTLLFCQNILRSIKRSTCQLDACRKGSSCNHLRSGCKTNQPNRGLQGNKRPKCLLKHHHLSHNRSAIRRHLDLSNPQKSLHSQLKCKSNSNPETQHRRHSKHPKT